MNTWKAAMLGVNLIDKDLDPSLNLTTAQARARLDGRLQRLEVVEKVDSNSEPVDVSHHLYRALVASQEFRYPETHSLFLF